MTDQSEIDARNQAFWNEACGSTFARDIGASATDQSAIEKFDREFFRFYPYLESYINFPELSGKDVLEVGLGYGSVSQRLANISRFTGLDIARGPVDWVNHRLATYSLQGSALQGSILEAPFANESYDAVVTIGCLHHTGDFKKALSEVHRVLRPGGRVVLMVYNATNYFRWIRYPAQTLRYLVGTDDLIRLDEAGRARTDVNLSGEVAPETVLQTESALHRTMRPMFRDISISRENTSGHRLGKFVLPRDFSRPILGRWLGLDLYATAIK